ncbi:NTP transferase domain-containing protein [Paenibacillus sp. LMG 31459]|uniref:NTP transferase domain-containing protein n=1 Tax=Paenibacillus phytohabitans TaxID=2654978 RepID=A0ABX1YL20_9BACL|nr:sugar phosphate nucleotidyltransferase [Paenibacillus phytohabitans]NOU80480.1 NTP transferase domain-containing protein [Paenibacillus phytohabitans]
MHTILLSGGSGMRLWPLSGSLRSKMFLPLLPAPDGGTESMIGRVCRQLAQAGLDESVLFVAHQEQLAITRRYTGNKFPVIGEPHKRGTFTAAAYGALHLYSAGKARPEDIICVAPADMYADEDFFRLFPQFPDILASSQAELLLLGTQPAYPSDQYGYIVPAQGGTEAYAQVLSFAEKPDIAKARELIEEQALWNCGVFAFRLSFLLSHLQRMGLPADHAAFAVQYAGLPVRSFDKEVAEHSTKAVVVRHKGEWSDLGSWDTLAARLDSPLTGEGGLWGECRDTHIVNELKVPLHVIGVPGIVAIASPEGILVAARKEANMIKDILQEHSVQEPRYGEAGWGSYTLLDQAANGTRLVLTMILRLLPEHDIPEMDCKHSAKTWMIVSGHGEVTVNGAAAAASAGGIFTIARGDRHAVRAVSTMKLIEVRISEAGDDGRIYGS